MNAPACLADADAPPRSNVHEPGCHNKQETAAPDRVWAVAAAEEMPDCSIRRGKFGLPLAPGHSPRLLTGERAVSSSPVPATRRHTPP